MYCFSGQWQWMVLPQYLVDTYTHQMERNINSLFMASLWLGMCKEVRNRVLPKLCFCSKNEQPFDIGRKKVASATRISCTLVLRWETLMIFCSYTYAQVALDLEKHNFLGHPVDCEGIYSLFVRICASVRTKRYTTNLVIGVTKNVSFGENFQNYLSLTVALLV